MKKTNLFCGKDDSKPRPYTHFYPQKTLVKFCGAEEVVEVIVRELKEGEESFYWAWWDNETEKFSMIYPSKVQSDVCFTYGAEAAGESGEGKQMNVFIEEIINKIEPKEEK